MHTRTPKPRELLIPIGFALVTVAAAIAIWVSFGGSVPFQADSYHVSIELPSAQNIYPGSDIQIAGVTVGRVTNVVVAGRGARATFDLDPRYVPLRLGTTAITRTKTLLGEGYIELNPGPNRAPAIPDGGRIPAGRVLASQQLDQALQTFAPSTRRNISAMFGGLAKALQGRGSALGDSAASSGPAFSNLASVAQILQLQRGALQQMIISSGAVLHAVGTRAGALQTAVTNGEDVLAATARRNAALTAIVGALPPFLHQLKLTSNVLGRSSSDFTAAVDALLPSAPALAPALSAVDAAAPQFRGLFTELPKLISAGHTGLPAASTLARATGTAFRQLYPASRQLIPFFQLASDLGPSIASFFANVGSASATSLVSAGGYITHVVNGIPSIWNETPAGWIKKLPTNVEDAYPEPGAAKQVANGGLRAYDCRNIHNPLYLPPTGTGAPACQIQGPWEFDGVNRDYPHLTEAPP